MLLKFCLPKVQRCTTILTRPSSLSSLKEEGGGSGYETRHYLTVRNFCLTISRMSLGHRGPWTDPSRLINICIRTKHTHAVTYSSHVKQKNRIHTIEKTPKNVFGVSWLGGVLWQSISYWRHFWLLNVQTRDKGWQGETIWANDINSIKHNV